MCTCNVVLNKHDQGINSLCLMGDHAHHLVMSLVYQSQPVLKQYSPTSTEDIQATRLRA